MLPAAWSRNNPVDILGDASPDRYAKALEIAAKDENSDGMLVILTPQDMTDPTETAEALADCAKNLEKPVLASWMGGASVAEGIKVLDRANIPTFDYPDTAARVFDYMANYDFILRRLYETPILASHCHEGIPDEQRGSEIIDKARRESRTLLTEYESKQLLAAYCIPTVETEIAQFEEEAVKVADQIGYPVVLKLHSEVITHKTDVGGVQLNLANGMEVREAFRRIRDTVFAKAGEFDPTGQPNFLGVTVQPMAKLDGYELILGSSIDPQFGPVLLFGLGGQLVEVFKDRALGLPPLNTTLARRMMERTKIYDALKGVRGRPPVDLASLELLMVRFSQLIAEQRWIKELDINPLLASPEQLLALDARVLLYDPETDEADLPRLAIRPYPGQYISSWIAKDNTPVTIRPIRAEDEPLMVEFHESLSDRSVYMRYMHPMLLGDRVAHERLSRICHGDYSREITLIADRENAEPGELRIIGVGRLSKQHSAMTASFSMLVSDQFQGAGIGNVLLDRIIEVAKQEKMTQIEAVIAIENQAMRKMCERRGFTITEKEGMLLATLALK